MHHSPLHLPGALVSVGVRNAGYLFWLGRLELRINDDSLGVIGLFASKTNLLNLE